MRRFLVVAVVALALGAHAVPTKAQSYPPDILDPSICLRLFGDIRVSNARILVLVRGRLGADGAQGCARLNERVRLRVRSHPVLIGETISSEDGSYRVEGRLPAHITVGDHLAIAEFGEGRATVQRPITVVSSFVQGAAATRGPVALPRTGAGIALLVLAALGLIGLGTALVVLAYRWLRRGHRPDVQVAEAPRVPRLDTADFTRPERPEPLDRAERPTTEAGLLPAAGYPPGDDT